MEDYTNNKSLGWLLVTIGALINVPIAAINAFNQTRADPWIIIPLLPLVIGLGIVLKSILAKYAWVKAVDRIGIIAGLFILWSRDTIFYFQPDENPELSVQAPIVLNGLIIGVLLITALHIFSNWRKTRASLPTSPDG